MTEVKTQSREYKVGSLPSSLQLKEIDGKIVPFQNGIAYPSFEPQNRQVLSLAGAWKKKRFAADHDWSLTIRDEQWIQETEKAAAGITAPGFDDSNWDTHSLPLPENQLNGKEEVGGAETYEDGVWYRKTFQLGADWEGKVISLKCLAVSYVGDFWINGKYVGYHEGGYTPFAFDITDFLQPGDNSIVIRVDNPPWKSRYDIVPAQDNDFFNYTGVIHDIFLEATDGIQVVRTDIIPQNTTGEVIISVVLENRTSTAQSFLLKGSIFDTDFTSDNWLAEPSAKSICQQEIDVLGWEDQNIELAAGEIRVLTIPVTIPNPKLWSIREPNLYVFEATLIQEEQVLDRFTSQFGIRTLEAKDANILLNEKPVFLAGVARHEEWPGFGRTASWDRIKSDFLKIRDLSVNMVRTAHYPNHVYTFIMLDRLGLTAMSEIPLWQFETGHYQAQEERKISYQMWREMVFSNYNRPSIIMWSTQNESSDVMLRKAYNENLATELKTTYNDGRLITQSAAADQPGYYDESMEPLDVAGWTMYFGIFHGSTPYEGTRNFIEQAHERWPEKPIINTEYGIWSNADDSFLEKQVEIYRDVQMALIEKATVTPQGERNENGYIAAIDYWTAFDWYVNHNRFYQTMGMLRMDRKTEKPLYHEFVRDHQRLVGTTNGFGIREASEQGVIDGGFSMVTAGKVEYTFAKAINLTESNYLILKVKDLEVLDGVNVEIKGNSIGSVFYQTYGIQANKEFDVFVPLWTLDQAVLREVTGVTITFDPNRMLEILEIASRN
ncbi:glycoside hydrolase family 2 [Caldibacillus lycopersici]|uniref:Glycoside hydrolase family 2 n=1 Tax=Perspicuibacillus lycopersici TaxID=1325689 RepID=A0AAE3LMS0_9BACI|nr:glycoside hydrolase family 2 TIM barrel-domain containing protein [Perspicuibacillus lycopersici]MCU9613062.1 glycoside hydrolase family 2 [Perspicuibacillus lycopersici]